MARTIKLSPSVLLPLLVGVTVLLYYQALESQFLLDDYVNLSGLTLVEDRGYSSFVFSGLTGNAGRPLSLFSFALQYDAWPDNPVEFKSVNLLLHLINGLLIYFLARMLTARLSLSRPHIELWSLLIAALWLLHPIQFSTVLYTIQRMNMLATFFILAGALGYFYFAGKYEQRHAVIGLAGMSVSVGLALVLGVLSKENAILLPVFILLIEAFLRPSIFRDGRWRAWAWLFLGLPLFLLACYLISRFGYDLRAYSDRPFSMGERLLTQGVVLFDYFGKILVPRLGEYGLFYDDFTPSSGFFSPPVTAIAWIFIAATIIISLLIKKRFPLIAFGILWFFAGHLLESTYLPLELYFEHRNYLPAFGLICALIGVLDAFSGYVKGAAISLFVTGYMALVLTISALEADLWSKPVLQAAEWARQRPESNRAVQNLANTYLLYDQFDEAKKTYYKLQDMFPEDIYPELQLLAIKSCIEGNSYTGDQWRELYEKAETTIPKGAASLVSLNILVSQKRRGNCDEIATIDLMRLVLVLARNPELARHRALLHEMAAILAIEFGDPVSALANINESIRVRPHPDMYIIKIKILIALNKRKPSEETLDILKKNLSGQPVKYIAYMDQLAELEEQIKNMKD